MNVSGGAALLPLLFVLLFAAYLLLLVLTVGRLSEAIWAARGGTEYLGHRLWRAVALLTFPFSLVLLALGWFAGLVRLPMRWVVRLLAWGGWLLLTGLIAFWTYQLVNALGPSVVGRAVLVAYIVLLPLLFAAADLAARRLGQKEADSRTWLRGVMAVTSVFGLITLGYLEVFHRRHIQRKGWMDALAAAALAVLVVAGISAVALFHGGRPNPAPSAPATAPPTAAP